MQCDRIAGTRYRIDGVLGDYLAGVSEQWLKVAPRANPALLEIDCDRDRRPLREMVMWAGEFGGYRSCSVRARKALPTPISRPTPTSGIEWPTSCDVSGRLASGIGAIIWRSASELIWIAPRTRMASKMMITLNAQATANRSDATPARRPMAVVSAATKAVWEDGMPPAANSRRHAKVRVRAECAAILNIWHPTWTTTATRRDALTPAVIRVADATMSEWVA